MSLTAATRAEEYQPALGTVRKCTGGFISLRESFLGIGSTPLPFRYDGLEGEMREGPEVAIALQMPESGLVKVGQAAGAWNDSPIVRVPGIEERMNETGPITMRAAAYARLVLSA
jgi:hypothetical protein